MAIRPVKKEILAEENHDTVESNHSHRQPTAHDESNWLISYADIMTLLCGFFAMLFSISTINVKKFEKIKEELSKSFGGDYTSESEKTAKFVQQIIQESGLPQDVVVESDALGTSAIIESTVFFDSMTAFLKETGRNSLEKLARAIRGREVAEARHFQIVIEGHTDSRPLIGGIYPSNWELSHARAVQVMRIFLDSGFEQDRIYPIGMGSSRPRFKERTPAGVFDESGLDRNRRVVIRILDAQSSFLPTTNDPSSTSANPAD